MRRGVLLLALGLVTWLALTGCGDADDETAPTDSVAPLVVTATLAPRQTSVAEQGPVMLADPLDDCLSGTRPSACVKGRDITSVTLALADATFYLDVATTGFDWRAGDDYLGYLLFDIDRDPATGDIDIAEQYGLGADVILLVRSEEEQVTLSLLGQQDVQPLLPQYVAADEAGTLSVRLPVRYVGGGDFEFAMFVLGSDAIKDQFPNGARVDMPAGTLITNP